MACGRLREALPREALPREALPREARLPGPLPIPRSPSISLDIHRSPSLSSRVHKGSPSTVPICLGSGSVRRVSRRRVSRSLQAGRWRPSGRRHSGRRAARRASGRRRWISRRRRARRSTGWLLRRVPRGWHARIRQGRRNGRLHARIRQGRRTGRWHSRGRRCAHARGRWCGGHGPSRRRWCIGQRLRGCNCRGLKRLLGRERCRVERRGLAGAPGTERAVRRYVGGAWHAGRVAPRPGIHPRHLAHRARTPAHDRRPIGGTIGGLLRRRQRREDFGQPRVVEPNQTH